MLFMEGIRGSSITAQSQLNEAFYWWRNSDYHDARSEERFQFTKSSCKVPEN